jgi:hypothetical protein
MVIIVIKILLEKDKMKLNYYFFKYNSYLMNGCRLQQLIQLFMIKKISLDIHRE